jgi:hypothetical protein
MIECGNCHALNDEARERCEGCGVPLRKEAYGMPRTPRRETTAPSVISGDTMSGAGWLLLVIGFGLMAAGALLPTTGGAEVTNVLGQRISENPLHILGLMVRSLFLILIGAPCAVCGAVFLAAGSLLNRRVE